MRIQINNRATALLAISLGLMTACSKEYDDTPLRERLDKVETVVSSAEARANALGKELEALRQIANAIKDRNAVTEVKEQRDSEGNLTAYVISFERGADVTISMAKDGSDAVPPQISLYQHSDGHFYWQVGNKLLVDASGKMYRADGDMGKTPRVKIENDNWYASYNEGVSWVLLGRAKGQRGPTILVNGLIEKVDYETDPSVVSLSFTNLASVSVPRVESLRINFDVPQGIVIMPYKTYKIPFTITGRTHGLRLYLNNLYMNTCLLEYTEGANSGIIHIESGNATGNTIVLVASQERKKYQFSYTFESGILLSSSTSIGVAGFLETKFEVPVKTNLSYKVEIAEEDKDWLSVSDLRAVMKTETLRFTAKVNPRSTARSARVRLLDLTGQEINSISVNQSAAEDKERVVELTLGAGESFANAYNRISQASYVEEGSYFKLDRHIHLLKIKGTPTAQDWADMEQRFTTCRTLDLGESNIAVIPEGGFDNYNRFISFITDPAPHLEYVIFPRGLKRIESRAFRFHDSLRDVVLPEGVVVADDAFHSSPVEAKIRR